MQVPPWTPARTILGFATIAAARAENESSPGVAPNVNQPRTLAYGLAEFPMAMAVSAMTLFIPVFYARELGLSLGLVTLVLTAARGTDLLTDPLVGWLSDRTRSRWGRRKPWIMVGAPIMLLAVIAFTWLLTRVAEPPPLEVRRVTAWEGLRFMWRNGPFKRLLVAFGLAALGPAMAAPVFFFYVDQIIAADVPITTPLLVFYTGNLLGVALWGALAERIGKRRAWMTAMWLMVLVQPAYLCLGPGDLAPMLVILFLAGTSAGSLVGLPCSMKADVIDLDRLATGADRTGLFFSSWSLVQKGVASLALAFSLLVLTLAGFEPAGPNGPTQLWALKLAFAGLPTLCYAAALLVIRPYPLNEERHRLVLRQLAARAT